MSRARFVALLTGAMIALIVPPASAAMGNLAATTRDIAATTRYVADTSALFKAVIAAHKRETASMNAVAEDVSAHCRGALPRDLRIGTPAQQRIWTALENDETAGELLVAFLRSVRKAYAAAARGLEHLHWARPAINRAVAADAHHTLAALTLTAPDQCADVRAAAASNFTAVPITTRQFLARAIPLFGGSDAAPAFSGSLKPLGPYITATERPKVRALRSLATKLNRVLGTAYLNAYLRVTAALPGQ